MRWSLLAGLVAAVVALPLMAEDKKEEVKKDRKEKFADLKAAYNDQMKAFREGMKEVKTQQQYIELIKEKGPKSKDTLIKILELVEENPKDELSLDMLTTGLNFYMSEPKFPAPRGLSPEAKKIVKFLSDAHAASPKVVTLTKQIASRPSAEFKPLMEMILAKNEDKEAKAFSAYFLANLAFEMTDDTDKSVEERAAATKEAEKYFEIMGKDYADVAMGKRTMGEMAKRFLFDLKNLQVGMKAPDVTTENLEGKKEKLSDYKGKVVVLDIWATWCGPCRAMIPHEREMVKRLEEKPFVLISVSADAKKETLEKFLENEKMPWNHWWVGNQGGMTEEWNVRFYPTIYIIDAKGVIRHKNIRGEEMEEAVNKLIKEAEMK